MLKATKKSIPVVLISWLWMLSCEKAPDSDEFLSTVSKPVPSAQLPASSDLNFYGVESGIAISATKVRLTFSPAKGHDSEDITYRVYRNFEVRSAIATFSASDLTVNEAGKYEVIVDNLDAPFTPGLNLDEDSIAAFNVKAVFHTKVEDDNNIWVKVPTKASVPSSAGSSGEFYATEGNNATIAANGTQVLKAIVLNPATNSGTPGVVVTFNVFPSTAGTMTSDGTTPITTATTDASGVVQATFKANATVGPAVVVATSTAGGASFNLTIGSGSTGAQLLRVAGDNSIIMTGAMQSLRLLALDGNNAALAAKSVTFSISSGSTGTLTGGVQTYATTTDSSGYAAVDYTAGSITGSMSVLAVVAGVGSASFAINVTTPVVSSQFYATEGNNTTVSTEGTKVLKAIAINSVSNSGIQGIVVTFSVFPSAAGTMTSDGTTPITTATTDANGVVQVTFKANAVIGPAVVVATSTAGGASFNLTVGAVGTGSQLLKVTGDGSSINTSTLQLLRILALDVNNGPITAANVTFSISSGGTGFLTGGSQTYTTVTDANGYASVNYTSGSTAGSMSVVGSVAGVGSTSFTINVASSGGAGGGASSIAFSPTSLSPASTTWLNVPIGLTADKSITVSNATSGNIYVNSISSTTSHFSVVSDTCVRAPTPMATGATCSVLLRFAPAAATTYDRLLFFNWSSSSDGSNPQLATAALQGTGPSPVSDFAGISSISGVTYNQMTINWVNYPGNYGYAVYSVSGGVYTLVSTVAAGGTSYTATGLTSATSYSWRVYVLNSALANDTNTNTVSATTLATPLVPVLTVISPTDYIMSNSSKNNNVKAGGLFTVDLNNIAFSSPGDDTGMTYACKVGRTITGSCASGSKSTCSAATLPGVYALNASTGVLSWKPAYSAQGTYEFCITGTNANGSATNIFPVNVLSPTFGSGAGDSTANFIADYRAPFSNFSKVATDVYWEDIYGGFTGTVTGSGTWAGTNANAYTSPLRLNFTSNTKVNFGSAITGYPTYFWDAWVNNDDANFSASNNATVILQKDSVASTNGFALTQNTDPTYGTKQVKFRYDQNYPAMVVADGATVYYRFDETSGTVLTDSIGGAGGGNNGSINSASNVAFGVAGALTNETTNRAIQKAVNTASLTMPNTASFKSTNNFSIELWFLLPPTVSNANVFNYYSVIDTDGISIAGYASNTRMAIRDSCGVDYIGSHRMFNNWGSSGITSVNLDNQWHHLVVTYGPVAGTNYRTVYMDGLKTASRTCGTGANAITAPAATPTYRNFGDPSYTLSGATVDEFAYYGSTVLTATQVKNHYMAGIGAALGQATFPSNAQMQDGPVGYWRLGEAAGATRALDSSGYGNHGLYGTAPTLGQPGIFSRSGIAHLNNTASTTNGPGSGLDDDTSAIFNNLADSVTIPGSTSLVFAQTMTAEAWVYFPAYPSSGTKVLMSQDGVWQILLCQTNYNGYLQLTIGTQGGCNALTHFKTANFWLPESGGQSGFNSIGWYHLAVVFDGTQSIATNRVRLYVNGDAIAVSSSVTTLSGYYTGTPTVRIGKDAFGNPALGNNIRVDEVAIYNKALTSSQIMARLHDASYRYCVADITPPLSSPSIANPYDHIAALFNGVTTNFFLNGREKCRLRTGSSVALSADTNDFELGSSTSGFVGGITETRLFAGSSAITSTSTLIKNFLVGADMHRPQPIGNIKLTGLSVAMEPGSALDGVRPRDSAAACVNTPSWVGVGYDALIGQLYNFTSCSTTNGFKGVGVPVSDPYRIFMTGSSNMYVALGEKLASEGTALGSVCAWFNSSSIPVSTGIVSKAKTANALFLGGDNTMAGKIQFNINGTANKAVSTNSVADGAWHYACGTYDGAYVRLYVDGAFNDKVSYSSVIATTTDQLAIGANVNQTRSAATEGFTGSIGGVHIYSTSLTSDDVYNNCVAQSSLYSSLDPAVFCTLSASNP